MSEAPLVLIVDDNDDGRTICAEYLRFRGFRVETAPDGLTALERAAAILPDLILMDLSLPVLDGWEATRRLKQSERTRRIPVVALTAHAISGIAETAIAAGCAGVLTKPIEPRGLEKEVRRYLSQVNL